MDIKDKGKMIDEDDVTYYVSLMADKIKELEDEVHELRLENIELRMNRVHPI